jgi:CRP-like cAMP-binding protein
VFGWSAVVPPYASTAGTKAITAARLIRFDAQKLRQKSEEDCDFGYRLMSKIAAIIRDRLNALRLETLSYLAS